MGRSVFDGVSQGEWSVFAEKVVLERDIARTTLQALEDEATTWTLRASKGEAGGYAFCAGRVREILKAGANLLEEHPMFRLELCMAGFTLYGWRQPNGFVKIGDSNLALENWPPEIEHLGHTYTLEEVVQPNPPGTHGEVIFENAEYA